MTDDINKKDDETLNGASNHNDALDKAASKKAEKIDLDKEIENLDEFLMESEEDEQLVLDDEEHVLTASSFKKEKKQSAATKYVGYMIFILLLCGVLYAGIIYGPKMLSNSDLDALQQNLENRTAALNETPGPAIAEPVQDEQAAVLPVEENVPTPPAQEAMNGVDPLPMAADEAAPADEIVVEENAELAVSEAPSVPAESIADALALTQAAQNADSEDVAANVAPIAEQTETSQEQEGAGNVTLEDEIANLYDENNNMAADEQAEASSSVITDDQTDVVERTRAASFAESQDADSENLPPLGEDQIQIANDVMKMPAEQISEVVEASEQVAAETEKLAEDINITTEGKDALVESAVKDTVEKAAENTNDDAVVPAEEIAETVVRETEEKVMAVAEDNAVIDRKAVEAMDEKAEAPAAEADVIVADVKEETPATPVVKKQAVPVVNAVSKPAAKQQPSDPRVEQAQSAYSRGDYSAALSLYSAVLAQDPTNTRALTGRQMAQAKMRLQPAASAPIASVSGKSSAVEFPVTVSSAGSNIAPAVNSSVFEGTVVEASPEAAQLRSRLRQSETIRRERPAPVQQPLNATVFESTVTLPEKDNVLLPQPVATTEVINQADNTGAALPAPISKDDIIFFNEKAAPAPTPAAPSVDPMPVMAVETPVVVMPTSTDGNVSAPAAPVAAPVSAKTEQLQSMIREAEANPKNAALAVAIGDAFGKSGDKQNAAEWYKQALKRDSLYKTGLDRMSIYDRLAGVK